MGSIICAMRRVREFNDGGDTRGVEESEEGRQRLDRERGEAEEGASTGRDQESAQRQDRAASGARA